MGLRAGPAGRLGCLPPQLGAIHRVIPGLDARQAAEQAAAAFRIRELPGGTADRAALLAELAAAEKAGVGFVLAGDGQAWLLT